jgi:beta-phosphoglucomutase-like phosphatase (HAD superfamily)
MPRTVVPPKEAKYLDAGATQGDSVPEKLVKYIPGEALAFFVPVAAALGTKHNSVLVAAVVVGGIGTVGYLWVVARKLDATSRPLPHFYVLAVIAFAAWALATTASVQKLVGVDDTSAGVGLLFAVFLIPLTDSVCNELKI